MGRGDGRDRIISGPDADDTGAGILHVDMDAFYAAVEVLDDPSLKGKPVIVGGLEGRGVVSSASYEARRYGVRSAMSMGQALRLCPSAITVVPHFDRYLALSEQVMGIFRDVTPLVEPLSIDEAFLDVRGARRLWGTPGQIARAIRRRVEDETGLTCSIGAAATKHVAKMVSTMCKPDGLLIVAEHETAAFLRPRSVRAMWGVGPKAAETLESRAIRTIGDVLAAPQSVLDRLLGPAMGERVAQLARGDDPRSVTTERVEKSIGHEETFMEDVSDRTFLRSEFLRLSDRVAKRLRRAQLEAATVAIKVRYDDFTTVSRSRTLAEPTDVGHRIGVEAFDLFETLDAVRPIRLIGVRGERLRPAAAGLSLWDEDEERRRLEETLDRATHRFGSAAVTRASLVGRQGSQHLPSHPRGRESLD